MLQYSKQNKTNSKKKFAEWLREREKGGNNPPFNNISKLSYQQGRRILSPRLEKPGQKPLDPFLPCNHGYTHLACYPK